MRPCAIGSDAPARAALYALLSRAYLREPDVELIRYFRRPEVRDLLTDLGLSPGREFAAAEEESLQEALAQDYAALFLSPPRHIPAVESFFVGGLQDPEETFEPSLQGNAAGEVSAFYRRHGIRFPAQAGLLPDHIAVEFEALRLFCEREAAAAARGEEAAVRETRRTAARFLAEHPNRWVGAFCQGVERMAGTPFYRMVAGLTRAFVNSEMEELAPERVEMEDVTQ